MRLKKRAYLVIFFLFLSLLAMAVSPVISPKLKKGFLSSFSPMLKGGGFLYRRINPERNHEVAELTQEIISLREASIENERLRGLLAFKKKAPYKVIPARVIGRDSANWYSIIIIDKGLSEEICEDMVLVVPGGLVGRIIEVSGSLSRGMLIVDPNSRVGAMVQRSRAQGVVWGTLKGRLRMKYIPLDADVKKGDIIITSGMGGIFPKGMAIGKVKSIETDSGGLHLYAWVEPMAALSRLEEVLCVVRAR